MGKKRKMKWGRRGRRGGKEEGDEMGKKREMRWERRGR